MIEIKKSGMCKGCEYLDLIANKEELWADCETSRTYYNPTCSHYGACKMWYNRLNALQNTNDISEDDNR